MALKRLQKELMQLMANPLPVGSVAPTDDPLLMKAYLKGPEGTAYEGGVFEIELKFTIDYPNRPPNIRFITRIFHANVHNHGTICVTLMSDWRQTDTIATILLALNNLLAEPNRDSAYTGRGLSEAGYYAEAKRCTQTYAFKR